MSAVCGPKSNVAWHGTASILDSLSTIKESSINLEVKIAYSILQYRGHLLKRYYIPESDFVSLDLQFEPSTFGNFADSMTVMEPVQIEKPFLSILDDLLYLRFKL